MKHYNVEVMNKKYGILKGMHKFLEPPSMQKYDAGTNLMDGHRDYSIPEKDLNKVKAYFKKKHLKIKVTYEGDY
jgi:hypothetical protein